MTERTVLIPGPSHPISIEHSPSRVVVKFGGEVIADSKEALVLHQAGSPSRFLFPRKDIKMDVIEKSELTSYCPYKGEASYFNIKIGDASAVKVAFSYEAPHAAVADIKEHLGFYTEKVDSIVEEKAS